MKVLGIVGSPRKNGNTDIIMDIFLSHFSDQGLDTIKIHLGEKEVKPCDECLTCKQTKDCHLRKDDFKEIFSEMLSSDAIIFSSPVFFGSAPAQMSALMDRAGYLGTAMNRPFEKKVGGAIVTGRRAGHNFTFMQLLHFFLYHGMIVPGSTYWNIVHGRDPGDVLQDKEGLDTVHNFASNLQWLLMKLKQEEK